MNFYAQLTLGLLGFALFAYLAYSRVKRLVSIDVKERTIVGLIREIYYSSVWLWSILAISSFYYAIYPFIK